MMIDVKKYTHLIWDWNGTLLDDVWLCVDVMNGMLKEYGLPLRTVEEYQQVFDFPVKDYYEKLGYDFNQVPFDVVGMDYIRRYNLRYKEFSLFPEVPAVLSFFKSKGYTQYILSAREHNELISETKSLGVFGYFEDICGLDDHYAHGKSETGLLLISKIKAPKENILFIGDTRHDAEVAGELGIDCVLVTNGHHSKARLNKLGVPMVPTLDDLIK
ncbi:MAG: HAD family hydrolase [Bacteroidales bacterium]|nr:HAD family hydrolase [Bacteroidales bacterium]